MIQIPLHGLYDEMICPEPPLPPELPSTFTGPPAPPPPPPPEPGAGTAPFVVTPPTQLPPAPPLPNGPWPPPPPPPPWVASPLVPPAPGTQTGENKGGPIRAPIEFEFE